MLVQTAFTPRPAPFSRPACSEFRTVEWRPLDETASGYLLSGRFGTLEIPRSRAATLGRLHENDLAISSPDVSRRHAAMRYRGGKVEVCDLGSTCGTTINGKRVPARQWTAVPDGAMVGLASTLFELNANALSREAVAQSLESMNLPVDVLHAYLNEVAKSKLSVFTRTRLQAMVERVVAQQRHSAFDLKVSDFY